MITADHLRVSNNEEWERCPCKLDNWYASIYGVPTAHIEAFPVLYYASWVRINTCLGNSFPKARLISAIINSWWVENRKRRWVTETYFAIVTWLVTLFFPSIFFSLNCELEWVVHINGEYRLYNLIFARHVTDQKHSDYICTIEERKSDVLRHINWIFTRIIFRINKRRYDEVQDCMVCKRCNNRKVWKKQKWTWSSFKCDGTEECWSLNGLIM